MSVSGKRVPYFLTAIVLSVLLLSTALFPPKVHATAADLTSRSLTLQDGSGGDGGSKPSGKVNHDFKFTIPSGIGTVKSIMFQYCTTADIDIGGTCTTPTGLKTDGTNPTTLGTESGFSFTSLTNTVGTGGAPGSNGMPYVSDPTGLNTGSGATTEEIPLDAVTNPDGTDCGSVTSCTFYVRISAYDNATASGTLLAAGTVAASTNAQIVLTGTMPESLIFCTGGSIPLDGNNAPDCASATSGAVTFPMLFSPAATAYTTSQMAASTNATTGYAITVSGTTLTNGSYTIPAMSTAGTSTIGTGQFGMNLAVNTTPTVGTAITCPTTAGAVCHAEALTGYNTADTFQFKPSTTPGSPVLNNVADSTGQATDSQEYTASYIVNVAGSQAAGEYTTTLTYICTATF